MSWNWSAFIGDPQCLKWARRDLETLEAALKLFTGRTAAIQAGGNLGIFPKRLAEDFETVYTFEPAAHLFSALVHNASERNIIKLQAVAGFDRQPVALSRQRRDGSSRPEHDGLTHVAGSGVIPSLRIDDLGLQVCDLIYLDVEGWELNALRGAVETIRRCRPVIAVEINRGIEFTGASADELRSFIISHGYIQAFKMHSDEVFIPAG